jgi:diacylglycerol kinase family enzyme
MSSRHVVLILNHSAGAEKDGKLPQELVQSFADHAVDAEIRLVNDGDDITAMAREAAKSPCLAVVACGGDGTVNAVASALVGSETPLGVLPLGTLNHFAKDLKLPLEVKDAVAAIATGVTTAVDVAQVNGRIFVNNSSLGLYPQMVRGREQEQRLGRSKWTGLFWAALAVLRRLPILTVALQSEDGTKLVRRTPLLFIGNNAYEMHGFEIGSRNSLSDGKLAVYVVHHDKPASLLRMGLEALLGQLKKGRGFDFLSVREVRVESNRPSVQVATDGEVTSMKPPLVYRTQPLALKVRVPAAS